MTILILIVVCVLAALVVVQFGAVVELFRQVQQIRDHLKLNDHPAPIDIGEARGLPASAVGLPTGLDDMAAALVLFLSHNCATCRSIAETMAEKGRPAETWIIVEPIFNRGAESFIEEYGLAGDRTLIDEQSRIADRLGLDVTPAAVVVQRGRLERAATVPSGRQLTMLLQDLHKLEPADDGGAQIDHTRDLP